MSPPLRGNRKTAYLLDVKPCVTTVFPVVNPCEIAPAAVPLAAAIFRA